MKNSPKVVLLAWLVEPVSSQRRAHECCFVTCPVITYPAMGNWTTWILMWPLLLLRRISFPGSRPSLRTPGSLRLVWTVKKPAPPPKPTFQDFLATGLLKKASAIATPAPKTQKSRKCIKMSFIIYVDFYGYLKRRLLLTFFIQKMPCLKLLLKFKEMGKISIYNGCKLMEHCIDLRWLFGEIR